MVEGSLKSYDPVAYYINNIEDLDRDVRQAHLNNDSTKVQELTNQGQVNFDVFICVNKHSHAFVLCVNVGDDSGLFDMMSKDPNDIPELNFCWKFELCYESMQLKTYKIKKEFNIFKEIQPSIKRSFYIGKFEKTAPKALQFAALRASPHRYNVLLNDCVEFAKEFCISLLSYCSNYKELEEVVHSRLREASATGLSIEKLSRNVRSSGWLGNSFLNGLNMSSIVGQGNRVLVVAVFLFFLLVYPVIVALIIVHLMK